MGANPRQGGQNMNPDDPQYLQFLRITYCIGEAVADSDVQVIADRAERTIASVQARRRLGLRDDVDSTELYEVVTNKLDRARRLKRDADFAQYDYGNDWLEEMEASGAFALLCIQITSTGTPLRDGLEAHFAEQPCCGTSLAPAQARLSIETLKLHPGADRDIDISDSELVDRACLLFYAVVAARLPQLEEAADRVARGGPPKAISLFAAPA